MKCSGPAVHGYFNFFLPETVSSLVSSLNLFICHVLLSEHLRHTFLQQSLSPSTTVNSNLISHSTNVSQSSQSFRQIPVAISNTHHSSQNHHHPTHQPIPNDQITHVILHFCSSPMSKATNREKVLSKVKNICNP